MSGMPVFSILLWTVVLVSGGLVAYWSFLLVLGGFLDLPSGTVHDPASVQARILTIDNESVVQQTVDALPEKRLQTGTSSPSRRSLSRGRQSMSFPSTFDVTEKIEPPTP